MNDTLESQLPESLNEREREILHYIAEGLSNREIAERLFLALDTVKWHLSRLYDKMEVASRTQAVARARELGLLDGDEPSGIPMVSPHSTWGQPPPLMAPLIGREKELAELNALIETPEARLISILGPGGVGKTRLAAAAAEHQSVTWESLCFLPLLSVHSWEHLVTTIAQALGIEFYQATSLHEQLVHALQGRRILLVLDDFESLVPEAGRMTDLLAASPWLKIVVTSRERLDLSAEVTFFLNSFEIGSWPTVAEAQQTPAAQLFIRSARRVQPGFDLSPGNLASIHRICCLVEGIPLGIELAAAWVDTLSPDEVADEIARNSQFLEVESRDIPERHRSMWATFQSSWDRLTPEERGSLSQMAVFSGGFTRQAAQSVAGANVASLRRLINKSLLIHVTEGRYRIHSLLQQFLIGQQKPGDLATLRRVYSGYYLGWLEEQETLVKGRGQRQALDDIERDFDNIRSAWRIALEQDRAALGRGLESLFWFCMMRNRYLEGESLLQESEQQPMDGLSVRIRLCRLWLRRWREGSFRPHKDIIERLDELTAIFRREGDTASLGKCRLLTADALRSTAGVAESRLALLADSLQQFQAANDDFYTAWALHFMSRQAASGIPEAIELQQRSLDIRRQCGDLNGVIYSLYNLSVDLLQMGQLAQSARTAQEMLELSRDMNERSGELMATTTLCLVACFQGDFDEAAALNEQVSSLWANLHHPLGQTFGLLVQALLALIQGKTADAQTRLAALDSISSQGIVRFLSDLGLAMLSAQESDEREMAGYLADALNEALKVHGEGLIACCLEVGAAWAHLSGDPRFAESLLAKRHEMNRWLDGWPPVSAVLVTDNPITGKLASIEQMGQRLLARLNAGDMPGLAANQALTEPLSTREIEVLTLIAQGLSNQEISERLTVELSTVKKHITGIYGKLEVASRTQAVLRAQDLGLV